MGNDLSVGVQRWKLYANGFKDEPREGEAHSSAEKHAIAKVYGETGRDLPADLRGGLAWLQHVQRNEGMP